MKEFVYTGLLLAALVFLPSIADSYDIAYYSRNEDGEYIRVFNNEGFHGLSDFPDYRILYADEETGYLFADEVYIDNTIRYRNFYFFEYYDNLAFQVIQDFSDDYQTNILVNKDDHSFIQSNYEYNENHSIFKESMSINGTVIREINYEEDIQPDNNDNQVAIYPIDFIGIFSDCEESTLCIDFYNEYGYFIYMVVEGFLLPERELVYFDFEHGSYNYGVNRIPVDFEFLNIDENFDADNLFFRITIFREDLQIIEGNVRMDIREEGQ